MEIDVDVRLAEALGQAGYPANIIAQARRGHWSDFRTELALPKLELVEMLQADKHTALARRVIEGEFDG